MLTLTSKELAKAKKQTQTVKNLTYLYSSKSPLRYVQWFQAKNFYKLDAEIKYQIVHNLYEQFSTELNNILCTEDEKSETKLNLLKEFDGRCIVLLYMINCIPYPLIGYGSNIDNFYIPRNHLLHLPNWDKIVTTIQSEKSVFGLYC